MRGKQYLFFSLALIAALSTGCETNHKAQLLEKPTARIISLELQDVQLDYVTMLFDVEVNNPYPTSLPLVSLNYSLTSGASSFLTATTIKSTTVPPNRKEVVSLSDEVLYSRFLKALNSKPGSKITYIAQFQLWADAPNVGLIKLPAEHEGQLTLPNLPEIKMEDRIYHSLDVVFIPTPQDIVEKMLMLAQVKKEDLVYDLGCGDGRIPVTAAKTYGCRAVGYDLDPQRVKESIENVRKNKVEHLVRIEQKDIFTLDLGEADVITLYLLPALNVKLIPQLEKLKPGSRIVSNNFDIEGVRPDKVVKITSNEDHNEHTIFLWTLPLIKEK